MELALLAGSTSRTLAGGIATQLGVGVTPSETERFPDGEVHVFVGPVRGRDLYVVHATGPPVDENLVELLMTADACRRAGAGRLTAVLPYFGYARHERRTCPGDAVGTRVVCDLLAASGFDGIVALDPHAASFEAICTVPAEVVSAWGALAAALRPHVSPDSVVVAPDEGALKLAERSASELGTALAVVRKRRISGEEVAVSEVLGAVAGRPVVLVDDMISTGATIAGAIQALAERGAKPNVVVGAVHGLFVASAMDRLAGLSLSEIFVTDSLVAPLLAPRPIHVVSIAPLLAETIGRLHDGGRIGSHAQAGKSDRHSR
jgi:ribose-phosphate pyrophosphokinase